MSSWSHDKVRWIESEVGILSNHRPVYFLLLYFNLLQQDIANEAKVKEEDNALRVPYGHLRQLPVHGQPRFVSVLLNCLKANLRHHVISSEAFQYLSLKDKFLGATTALTSHRKQVTVIC